MVDFKTQMSKHLTALYCTKNESEFIRLSVMTVLPYVDEVVIMDTLSTDRTPQIAAALRDEFPEKVRFIQHQEDFDMACEYNVRNIALSHCTGRWILALDADQCMSDNWLDKVRPFMKDPKCECIGVRYHHMVGSFEHEHKPECGVGDYTWVLFRRTPHMAWRPASEVCDWAKPNHHSSAERSCSQGSLRKCPDAAVYHLGFSKEDMLRMACYRAMRGDHGHDPEVKAARVRELQESKNPFLFAGPVERTINLPQELPHVLSDKFGKYELTLSPTGHILSRRNTLTGELM